MNNWIFLSYPLNPQAPAYGGGHGFAEKKVKQMDQGDSCDTKSWSMSNHMGTHIDFPRHFSSRGKDMDDYGPDFFIFSQPFLADISPAEPGLIITPDHLDISAASANTDLLLIKTGFGGLRGRDTYSQNNPGFHPDLADFLRERLPALRVLGFDSISLSSYAHRDLGREAHRAFLLDNKHPILPLEDMHLEQIDGQTEIEQVIIAPLRVTGADGTPCTVLGKVKRQ